VTRTDVEQWLATIQSQVALPDWQEFATELTGGAVQKARLRTEWIKYRAKALDHGDEAIRSVRRQIRSALIPLADSDLTLNGLISAILPTVRLEAAKHLSPYSDDRLTVMIIYEVFHHGEAGQLQNLDQKPSDKTP
jgi:hypothetical protein